MHIVNTKNKTKYLIVATLAAFFMICFLIVAYAVLINKTVLNVVAREKAENEITVLSSKVGDMEFEEMSLRNKITLELAYSLGFMESKNVTFVSRTPSTKSLSLSAHSR